MNVSIRIVGGLLLGSVLHLTTAAGLMIPMQVNGKYGVVDERGRVIVPFERGYTKILEGNPYSSVFVEKDGRWMLLGRKGRVLNRSLGSEVELLMPGIWRFKNAVGKYGVVNGYGRIVQTARFDWIGRLDYTDSVLQYRMGEVKTHNNLHHGPRVWGGKVGLVSARGRILTPPLYEYIDGSSVKKNRRGWSFSGQYAGRVCKVTVPGNRIRYPRPASGRAVRSDDRVTAVLKEGKTWLEDHRGRLLIPPDRYRLVDADKENKLFKIGSMDIPSIPSMGLISFVDTSPSGLCGYVNYRGKVMIPARFAACRPFDKGGAFVRPVLPDGKTGLFGRINRQGKWIVEPIYTSIAPWGGALSTYSRYVGVHNGFGEGVFDRLTNQEIIKPALARVDGLYKYDEKDRSFLDQPSARYFVFDPFNKPDPTDLETDYRGLANANAEVLVKPGRFNSFYIEQTTGRYFRASVQGRTALLDLDGEVVIDALWQELDVRSDLKRIFAYSKTRISRPGEEDKPRVLKAVYSLKGKTILITRTTACGAEQLQTGTGKPVWPLDVSLYCSTHQQADKS